jgi:L-aspartate oxidase
LARRQQRIPRDPDEVLGCYALDAATGEVRTFASRFVLLATGGAGRLYRYTTNPRVATGDGIAMAWRAGARVANMEFVQFHPTCLFHPTVQSFLVSEALRGEGGKLILPSGERFMPRYDERAELAPRDIVARAIDAEIKRLGLDCVYLDMRHLGREELASRFPNIYQTLADLDIDMATQPIPVVPAAHYFCGGVQTDLDGCTSLHRLLAVGEVACTGLHGANRLASNSLLEAVVFADTALAWCRDRLADAPLRADLPTWDSGDASAPDELVVIRQTWEEIRQFMWNYVGIVRTHRRMKRARRRIGLVKEEIEAYYWDFKLTPDLIELRNLADVADLVVQSALRRRESRGLHFTLDFPNLDERQVRDTVVERWL